MVMKRGKGPGRTYRELQTLVGMDVGPVID
jgi:hypothetical protein